LGEQTALNALDKIAPSLAEPVASAETGSPSESAQAARLVHLRKVLFGGFAALLFAIALAWLGWWYVTGLNTVSTDDAYVDAVVASITPQVSGTVLEVRARDTQFVHRGDVLAVLDPADSALTVAQTKAAYEQALRRVNGYFATSDAASADVAARNADVKRTEIDYQRRLRLFQENAIANEQVTTARNALDDARAALAAAQHQLAAQRAMIAGTDTPNNPEVLAAKAAYDKAVLDLSRTTIRAPLDGVVSQLTAQLGERVAVGEALMMVVPIPDMHVNANLKESQLKYVRRGEPVTLVSDLYGSDVVFHGRVEGLGGGTGAAFAVIPAQNATGNWIKVVQRLPVRITLDRSELLRHPLRIGLSMNASIDVSGAR
jgi:membrane fusion protein (multidrug efflux system)